MGQIGVGIMQLLVITTRSHMESPSETIPFVAVGDLVERSLRSTDNGSSFDNATSPTTRDLYGVTFGNNTFVAVG